MTRRKDLSDEENRLVQAELRRLRAELRTWRAVGLELGFPFGSAQQTISQAAQLRAGRVVAEALYAHLKTTRERFLIANGVAIAPENTADDAMVVIDSPQPTITPLERCDGLEDVLASDVRWWRPESPSAEQMARIRATARDARGKLQDALPAAFWEDELLRLTRLELRGNAKRIAPTVVHDAGTDDPLDDFRGGASDLPPKVPDRGGRR